MFTLILIIEKSITCSSTGNLSRFLICFQYSSVHNRSSISKAEISEEVREHLKSREMRLVNHHLLHSGDA
ncbi:unnamed protein product [Lactuca virosa]|uniref:Uncharacterized protein n=1 Tax=Lactuca virosa TaxID=75947 RepID=A0AAU9N9V3_9ASTR|nr:unnamed protein product [Lactuca virosa]